MKVGSVYRLSDDGSLVVLLGERGSGEMHQWKVFFLDTNDVDNVSSYGKYAVQLAYVRNATKEEMDRVKRYYRPVGP